MSKISFLYTMTVKSIITTKNLAQQKTGKLKKPRHALEPPVCRPFKLLLIRILFHIKCDWSDFTSTTVSFGI